MNNLLQNLEISIEKKSVLKSCSSQIRIHYILIHSKQNQNSFQVRWRFPNSSSIFYQKPHGRWLKFTWKNKLSFKIIYNNRGKRGAGQKKSFIEKVVQ
jgi:hypothetical protein